MEYVSCLFKTLTRHSLNGVFKTEIPAEKTTNSDSLSNQERACLFYTEIEKWDKITKIFGPREQISDQQKKFEIIHDLSSLTETNLEIF